MVTPFEQYQDQYGYTMLELITPGAGPVFTTRTPFEQTW